ncbi:transposase [Streptomyces sp. B21-102]
MAPRLPRNAGKTGRTCTCNRCFIEEIVYRYRTGMPWRDLPGKS